MLAWLIRWGTDAPVNHAFVYVGDGQIVEACPSGARTVPATNYGPIVWSHQGLSEKQRTAIVVKADLLAQQRVGYGWLDLVAIGLAQRRAGKIVDLKNPPWWVRRIARQDRLICSQLVDVCYQAAGVALFDDGRLPGLVSPGDLWRLENPS